MNQVRQIQRDIVRAYKEDMVKYADKKDKVNIRECFESIRGQLAMDNKKIQYSSIKKGSKAAMYNGLNLTGADVVIHYDTWWNMAVQNQAS